MKYDPNFETWWESNSRPNYTPCEYCKLIAYSAWLHGQYFGEAKYKARLKKLPAFTEDKL